MGLPENSKIKLRQKYIKGENNLITDVEGIKVGHSSLNNSEKGIHTGVTAIIPHRENVFKEKLYAGTSVINGFGKSIGFLQIEELGTIESPIIMTNTFSVGTALNALIKYILKENKDIGVETGTVNCVITECNDGSLNDIRGMHVSEEMVLEAIESADVIFEEGAIGSGSGMICMDLKGGIGSSSRIIKFDNIKFTIGSIVMSNFGQIDNLRINGNLIEKDNVKSSTMDKGSVIIVIATDIPLSSRQLKRLSKRATISLGKVGSYIGNGSGDISIAFSTANKIPHYSENAILNIKVFDDNKLDEVFEATVESVEESLVSSLYHSKGLVGIRNKKVDGLLEFIEKQNSN